MKTNRGRPTRASVRFHRGLHAWRRASPTVACRRRPSGVALFCPASSSTCHRNRKNGWHRGRMKRSLIALLLVIFLGLLVIAATAGFPGDEACLMDPCRS